MTLKEAFEMLAKSTKKGMKNPFFVLRNLSEKFSDIAENVEGGGDKVTVTQTITEGTEIGSIKVNNDTTTLYAPEGGSNNYSTTEQLIGKWTDNSNLYQITIEATTENNGNYQNIYKIPDGVNVKEINEIYVSNSGETITGAWINGNILYECAIANTIGANPEKYLMVRRITSDAGWSTVKFICTIKYTKNVT